MPKGRAEHAKIGLGDFEFPDASVGELRQMFLAVVRRDVSQALEALRELGAGDLPRWAETWGFNDPWLLDVAGRTVESWQTNQASAKYSTWADVIQSGEAVPAGGPSLTWEPTIETEAQFRARVGPYIADVKAWAAEQGLDATTAKPNLVRDMRALVQFHVKGDDIDVVADDWFGSDTKEDAARKAIADLARRMDLTLRSRK